MRGLTLGLSILLASLVLPTIAASQTNAWIVDDTPVPAPDFADIQSAIDAASDGDTILVEAGSYPTFAVDGKSLSILAVAAGTVQVDFAFAGSAAVRNTGANQTVALRGLDFDGGVAFENCAGSVFVEDATCSGGVEVDASPAVVLSRCVVTNGIDVTGSTIALYDTLVTGAYAAFPGVRAVNSEGFSSGGSIKGGSGAQGSTDPFGFFCDGGTGGPGLSLSGSTWRRLATSVSGGSGGPPGFSDIPGITCSSGSSGPSTVGTGLVTLSGLPHSLDFSSPVAEQGTATLTAKGVPGEHAFALLAVQTGSLWFPAWNGQLVAGQPWVLVPLGVLPAGGALELSFPIADLGATVQSVEATAQGLFVHASTLGPDFIGSTTSVVLIDRFLALDDCDLDGVWDSAQLGGGAPDCNGNGILDGCDIAQGLESDCNGNGVPDSCEVAQGSSVDCNMNGVPDDCDIAAGTSVDANGDGIPDECKTKVVPTQYGTIQGAIDAAQPGDTVLVLDGVYTGFGNKNFDLNGKAITVRSQNGPGACIIDANGSGGPIYLDYAPRDASVIGLTFRDYDSLSQSVVFARGSHALIEECVFEDNRARTVIQVQGDVLGSFTAEPVIRGCRFSNNDISIPGWGGAAIEVAVSTANPLIDGCEFLENTLSQNGDAAGGAVAVGSSASASLRNCVFAANKTYSWGTPNWQSYGGALRVGSGSTVDIAGCTFVANFANFGSAVHADGGVVNVTNSVFWLAVDQDGLPGESVYLENGAQLTIDHSTVEGGLSGIVLGDGAPTLVQGPVILAADPQFVSLVTGDFHLGAASPCVDSGDPAFAPLAGELDIDGDPRVLGAAVDMGADERQP